MQSLKIATIIRYRVLLAVVSAFSVYGQKDTAALVGTVLDSSGASIPGADVTAVNVDTNFTYRATSDTAGEWTISPVRIGSYRITVTANRFKTAVAGP